MESKLPGRRFSETQDRIWTASYDCRDPISGEEVSSDKDQLEEDMYQLAEKKVFLDHVPIMLSLTENFVCGVVGSQKEKRRISETAAHADRISAQL